MITKTRSFMTFAQVLLFVTGTVIVAPLATTIHPWNYDDPDHKYYCDYNLVMFSAIYFPSMWFFLILYGFVYALIKCFSARALELPWLQKLLQNLRLNFFTKNFIPNTIHKNNLLDVQNFFLKNQSLSVKNRENKEIFIGAKLAWKEGVQNSRLI